MHGCLGTVSDSLFFVFCLILRLVRRKLQCLDQSQQLHK